MRNFKITNNFKIFLSIIMVVVICIVTMGSTPIKTYTAYIDPELKTIISTSKATDLIPVDIWLYEIDTEAVDKEVKAKTGLDRTNLTIPTRAAEFSQSQVDIYIETERAIYAEAQKNQSQAFLDKYSDIFSIKATTNNEHFYVSKYAPSIQMELTPKQINHLVKDSSVESIYYAPKAEVVSNSDKSIPTIGVNYTRDTLGLTGNGIKIGIYEASEKYVEDDEIIYTGGLPARGSYNLPLNSIVFDPDARDDDYNGDGQPDTSEHASSVASIIMGEYDGFYEGIVPDAYIYATFNSLDEYKVRRNWRKGVEWLISRGVNVINMSVGFYYGVDADGNAIYTGKYTTDDRWADHLALQHHVHLVVSAGNAGASSGYVSSPGLAYNAITVGNLNINETTFLYDDTIYYKSSYKETNTTEYPNKPDVVAPGHNTQTGALPIGGTSAAAPHVTGVVAQLCQADTYLKTNPAAMKAVLCASTAGPHSYYTIQSNYDKYGAGLVNSQYAYNTAINDRYESDYFSAGTSDGEYNEHTFTINSTKSKVRIVLTWLFYKYINSSDNHNSIIGNNIQGAVSMPDLDLRIYDSNGNQLGGSFTTIGNVEIVQLENLPAGTYTMKIIAYTGSEKSINYSLAWWY